MRISDWSSDVCSSDLHAVRTFLAKRAADEIGRKNDSDDLFATIGGCDDQLEHAVEDIGNDRCVVAFPQQGLPGLDAVIPAEFAEQRQFLGIEACADRPVTDDAGGTVGNPSALSDYAARGQKRRSKERLGQAAVAPGAGRTALGTEGRQKSRKAAPQSP